MRKIHYVDLTIPNKIYFTSTEGLELLVGVKGITKNGDLVTRIQSDDRNGIYTFARGRYGWFSKGIGVFNFGKRGRGMRVHVKLEFPTNYSYEIDKCTTVTWSA